MPHLLNNSHVMLFILSYNVFDNDCFADITCPGYAGAPVRQPTRPTFHIELTADCADRRCLNRRRRGGGGDDVAHRCSIYCSNA